MSPRDGRKITPFHDFNTNETEEEHKQELDEMLSPANDTSLQEEPRDLKLKCSVITRSKSRGKIHLTLSSDSLTKYGYKELNDSQLDRIFSRLNRTYDVFGVSDRTSRKRQSWVCHSRDWRTP